MKETNQFKKYSRIAKRIFKRKIARGARHNNRALRFCGACKSDDNGVRMLSTPFSLDCETTEAQISQEFGADDDEDDEIDCDIYEEPKCVAA